MTPRLCGQHQHDLEPFRRLGSDRTGGAGLGLGLSIVRSIATAHQAVIRAEARAEGSLSVAVDL